MSTTTTKLGLLKPELTDAPPDITAMNPNWDAIDNLLGGLSDNHKLVTYTALDQLGLTPGSETIATIVQAMVDNSMLQMSVGSGYNVGQYPNNGYGTLVVFKKNNSRTLLLYSYTNTEDFGFYYGSYYNNDGTENWSGWTSYLPTSGGTITGNIDFKKVNNGHGSIYKNHSSSNDYGTLIRDEDANGNSANLGVSASVNEVYFTDTSGTRNEVYGEHNEELLKTNIAHNQSVYTDLSQIGLTIGSETIETISSKLPTYSRLVLTIGSTNNLSIYPNSNYGLLVVEKTVNSRILFTFTNNQGSQWVGVYSISSSGNTWTDWMQQYNASKSMVLTQYTHYGTTLPDAGTAGRLFFKKV